MSLRKRMLLSMGVALIAMIGVLCVASNNLLSSGFGKLERREVRRDMSTTVKALNEDKARLEANVGDWAPWDDTYNFVITKDPVWEQRNINDDTLGNLGLNILMVVDQHGEVVSERTLGAKSDLTTAEVRKHLDVLTAHKSDKSRISGILMLDSTPMLIASQPILTSKWEGPAHGSMIMGKYLNEKELGKRINLHIAFTAPNELKDPVYIRPVDSNWIAGYAIVKDLYGNPAFVIKAKIPRSVYKQGKVSTHYHLMALLAIGLLFGLIIELILEKAVLSRLANLSQRICSIGKTGDLSARLSVDSRDELGALANSMNSMLAELESVQAVQREQQAQKEGEKRYKILVGISPDAVLIEENGRCSFANTAAAELTGLTDMEGLDIVQMADPACRETLRRHIQSLYTGKETLFQMEGPLLRADGTSVDVEISGILFSYGSSPAVQLVMRDISQIKIFQNRLDHLAHHDPLTDLPNRLLLSDRLTQMLGHRGNSPAVIFIGLDRFKMVNDTLGHSIGDTLLTEIARRLIECAKDGALVARMGGDEFAMLLPQAISAEHVMEAAGYALDRIIDPLNIEGRDLFMTASAGISIYPFDGADAETLVKNADTAMYRAKELGGNTCCLYTEDFSERMAEKMRLENDMRRALERGEFLLHYQPRVELQTIVPLGMEALVRWKHPKLGLIPPGRFIPLAEETGLIIQLGEWVIRTACLQNKRWQRAGLPRVSVAVNVSARQFQQGNLVETVRNALADADLETRYLELEITESALLSDPDQAIETLHELKEMGVQISIDDFGTGYSSLSYLKRLPLNTVKIDQSFVKCITTNPDDAAIAGAVVAMAHSLNLRVIAEGVETIDQLEFLKSLKCDEMQGYFISRPVSPSDFEDFLRKSSRMAA